MTVGEGRTVTVSITEDMSALEIGELLESRGLVRDAKLLSCSIICPSISRM